MREQNVLVGKVIKEIFLAGDKQALKFVLADGKEIVVKVDGDCCSHSWVENIEDPEAAIGSEVISAEDISMPESETKDADEYDVIQFYGFKIQTAKGACVIDYRNSSNGYYGGNLSWSDDNYYGGVFGQNVSKENWKPV